MTRKNMVIGCLAAGLGLLLLYAVFHHPAATPNILLIVVDDLGYNDLAINNDNTAMKTPNMDQLARDGMRFTRHYATSVCSPARAALLTGMYPERLGFLPSGEGIPAEVVTLPERLRELGYTTWHIGKWHIGEVERTAWPDRQGFDHWFGFLNQWRLGGVRTDDGSKLKLAKPRYDDPWLQGDDDPGRFYSGHLENILTDKTIDVISGLHKAKSPWFVNLWYYAPHVPVTPALEFAVDYPNTGAGRYRALVNQLDHNIGRLVSHLDAIGELENTIVVVVSDNGGTNHSLDNNAPFAGTKATATEGGLRTPLIIRWPDHSLDGRVFPGAVSIQDIYPSLLAAIDAAPPDNLDGASFYERIRDPESVNPSALFWEVGPNSYSVLSAGGRWRLQQPLPFFGAKAKPKLFDFEQDPTAKQEVLPVPAEQLKEMTDTYKAWYNDVHTVKTIYTPGPNGSGSLTGMDLMRTPGFGPYTFGTGISDDYEGAIATQAGVWQMRRTGKTVEARFGSTVLAADLENPGSCHGVVVTGVFKRHISTIAPPDTIELALYLDGKMAQSVKVAAKLDVDDPAVETVVGDPVHGTGTITPPVILNTALGADTPLTLEAFSRGLCSDS